MTGSNREFKSMRNTVPHNRKGYTPLPIKNGLNATRVRVPESHTYSNITAWDFLTEVITGQRHRHPGDNDMALQQRFDDGEVVLRNRTTLRPESQLKPGTDVYFYRIPAPETPVPYDITIVYEDDNILVADKPPFMATMPRARHIVQTATVQLRRTTGIDDLSPAHRLDRLTSGLLLFTKKRGIRGAYQTLFANREVSKTYTAIAPYKEFETPLTWHSRMEKTPGEIQGRIVEGEPNAITDLVTVEKIDGTPYEAIHGEQPQLAKYILKPHTGKTHQLRLHMWQAGVPILGDPVYPTIFPEEAEDMGIPMHLTATELSFKDPLTGKNKLFTCDNQLFNN